MSALTRQNDEIEKTAARWVFRRETGLTPEAEAEFKQWLESDPRHAAALSRHERAWAVFDRPREAGQAQVLLQRLAERKLRRRRNCIVGAAMVALLLGMIGLQFNRSRLPDPANTVALVLPDTRVLEDGSVVELKVGAQIVTDFNEERRQVLLQQGEAHFQVAHQDRPFVVVAAGVGFRAVGTAFSVRVADTDVELLVTEGRVSVAKSTAPTEQTDPLSTPALPAESNLPAEIALVQAGNRIVVALTADAPFAPPIPTAIPSVELSERMAWRAPRLEFTETPVSKAAEMLNQYNPTQLIIEDSALGDVRVSGLFRADRIETFVRLLEANFDAQADYSEGIIRLRRVR